MPLLVTDLPVPLRTDDSGVLRVGNTRVTLDSVVTAYMNGSSAEQIADDFPTLNLADIHAVISFCLRHTKEVEEYLCQQRQAADTVRRQIEAIVAPPGLRQRLLARRSQKEQGDAPARG